MQVENGCFTPMVFSSCGGMGHETTTALRRLASLVAEKQKEDYGQTIALLRVRLNFALLRASLVCLRGTRLRRLVDPYGLQLYTQPPDLVLHDLRTEE